MAGLTREQRAAKEAALLAEQQFVDDGLVEMEKDGEIARVHPSAVKSHQLVGWKVKG
jgi:hypothetical protein